MSLMMVSVVLWCLQALKCLQFVSLMKTRSLMMVGLVLQLAGEPPKQQVVSPSSRCGSGWDQMDPG